MLKDQYILYLPLVIANDDPNQGGGNAPETTQLLNLLKKISENDKISKQLRAECKKTISKITRTPISRASTSNSKRG